MRPLVRCKVCGHVMAESRLGDKCPACGALRAAFEPYTDRISERRRRFLDLTLHPIAVHFPVSFSVAAVVLALAPPFLRGEAAALFRWTLKFVALFLPAVTALAFAIGWIDGRVRFRKIKRSPTLKKKFALGIGLFVASLGLAAAVWLGRVSDTGLSPAVLAPALVSLGCAFLLGLLGSRLIDSAWPGD